ncbi:glycoside hydrolase family protein [Myxosarcina sp. GI1]|uniref:glycoside hydrolase family 24 protein n=1 Tax=Myxosarcina sp. GI1 TaxID=1541065 RepID=UPI00209F3916|nr:glycoside hydrolase family protein [Myxosarcina sp. GI1]
MNLHQLQSYLRGSAHLISKIHRYFNQPRSLKRPQSYPPSLYGTQPLVMEGGDPYIRALMRTITASESNVARPYNVIYGGRMVEDLSEHPEICVPIVAGPNVGNCSTAAGRYQMLDITWEKQAQRYHPKPSGLWMWRSYSFAAEYQDLVVHDWLSDRGVWNADIPQLLRQERIDVVLRLLSFTWTSLGYGIETNSMSRYLPQVYQNMLQEELNNEQ